MALTRTAKGTATNKSSSNASITVAGVSIGAGSLIVVYVAGDGNAQAPASVTWGSLTLTQALAVSSGTSGSNPWCGIYYGVAASAGTNDVVATWGGTIGVNKMMAVTEVAGWAAAPVLD